MRRTGLCRKAAAALVLLLAGTTGGIAADDGPVRRDLKRIRQDEPWLRINAGGHTGTVQALVFTHDSKRLCSAGLDKNVEVWNLGAIGRGLRRVFLRERTIRWQVARGLRGSVYALACAPNDGLLAMGGYGAMGMLGEILLVNPLDGSLVKVLKHHRQTIRSLAFSSDGNWLASLDVAGEAVLWRRGRWRPEPLYKPDREHYGAATAKLIAGQPKLRPIVIAGKSHVILPYFVGKDADGRLQWKLVRIALEDRKDYRTLDAVHLGVVSAMAVSADGTRLASADLKGNLFLWDLAGNARYQRLRPGASVVSLGFSPDSRTLLAGTAASGAPAKSQLQIWDLATRSITDRRALTDHVFACAVSPDGRRIAYAGGQGCEVYVEPLRAAGGAVALRGKGRRVLKVAFAKEKPFYRVALGTGYRLRGLNDYADLEETFDTTRLSLGTGMPLDADDWISAEWLAGGWSVQRKSGGSLQLYRNRAAKGTVVLDPQLPHLEEGIVRCYCWLPDRQGKPYAIVVGTNLQNSIYVCRLVERGRCPIIRHFRGHHDYIASVGVSRDLRYLVSGSADGTVKFWSLAGYEQGNTVLDKWGAEFAVRGNQLVAASVHPAGPLFRKGLRDGDVVTELAWLTGEVEGKETRPAEMLQKLRQLPWGTQALVRYTRGGDKKALQLVDAWPPLASLFVSREGEWAFWTPAGYYDASVNGHRLFGWQVNRGVDRLPDFYRADQFYRKLERGDVMEKLLPAGSLPAAFRLAARPTPDLHAALPGQIAATPRVEILSPRPGALVRPGSNLVRAKVFANGVVAVREKLLSRRPVADGMEEQTYEWNVPLTQDEKSLIQVVVGTDAPTAAFGDVVVDRQPLPTPRSAKLFVVAAAVNKYGDPEIQPLAFSVADAESVIEAMRSRTRGLYDFDEATVLTNEKVTPKTWKQALKQLQQRLKNVAQPDDLVVLFLAGHGVVDSKTQKYYFVGHDLKLANFNKGLFAACISWDDFRSLADIPCRKLALLDTCHSGAIQPQRSRDLKRAVRQLHEDVIFTVTASTGEQLSAEKASWQHGAFTKCLLEALDGRADKSRDGVVTLDEAVAYVKRSVSELTGGGQTPTAAPSDILPFTSLPLTRVKR